jgi:hypothetical protein
VRDPIYRRRRFQPEIIELCVRWYLTYRLSYRDFVEMMAERGVVISHSTIIRWYRAMSPSCDHWSPESPCNLETKLGSRRRNNPISVGENTSYSQHRLCSLGGRPCSGNHRRLRQRLSPSGRADRTISLVSRRDDQEPKSLRTFLSTATSRRTVRAGHSSAVGSTAEGAGPEMIGLKRSFELARYQSGEQLRLPAMLKDA